MHDLLSLVALGQRVAAWAKASGKAEGVTIVGAPRPVHELIDPAGAGAAAGTAGESGFGLDRAALE